LETVSTHTGKQLYWYTVQWADVLEMVPNTVDGMSVTDRERATVLMRIPQKSIKYRPTHLMV
jgi:hypothetical protein